MTPSEALLEWKRNNLSAPNGWPEICDRLARGVDMGFAWPSLLTAGAKPVQIMAMVFDCIRESEQDIRRLPSNTETQTIDDVRKASGALLAALQGCQLLGENAPIGEVNGIVAAYAWTDHRAKILEANPIGLPVVSLPELLRALKSSCDDVLKNPNEKAIPRRTEDDKHSMTRAFIRRLAARFEHEYGKAMPENLARITYTVFELTEPMTGRDVEKILHNSPFRN